MKTTKLFTISSMFVFLITALTASSMFVLLIAALLMNSFPSAQNHEKNINHGALAIQYKDLAQEMLTKMEEKQSILTSKPISSYFGKTGMSHRARLMNQISEYEKTAIEYSQKALYHQKIADKKIDEWFVARSNQHNQQNNKSSL